MLQKNTYKQALKFSIRKSHLFDLALVMEKQFKSKHGRPTKQDQLTIQRILRSYYEKGVSATLTSKKTGINIKTVLNYFNKWNKEILESENKDFFQRCKQEKERSLLTLDNQLLSLSAANKEIDNQIKVLKKSENLPLVERFYKLKLKIISEISRIALARINLINTPTADTIIELNQKEFEKNDYNKS